MYSIAPTVHYCLLAPATSYFGRSESLTTLKLSFSSGMVHVRRRTPISRPAPSNAGNTRLLLLMSNLTSNMSNVLAFSSWKNSKWLILYIQSSISQLSTPVNQSKIFTNQHIRQSLNQLNIYQSPSETHGTGQFWWDWYVHTYTHIPIIWCNMLKNSHTSCFGNACG